MKLADTFDRVVLVNLRRRPDRLVSFRAALAAANWPFLQPERFEAVDGDKVGRDGAWGCLKSHCRILEKAILDDVGSLLILEDDAYFPRPETFVVDVEKFLAAVPKDWEGLMLGGQHIGGGQKPAAPGVVRCANCQRTHAYAVRGRYMGELYRRWSQMQEGHCDHVMGPFAAKFKVYAPDPFLIGQDAGSSDINGRVHPKKIWSDLRSEWPIVVLHATREVAAELRRRGLHMGFDRDQDTDIDKGLLGIFAPEAADADRPNRLRHWLDMVQGECSVAEGLVATVWHPDATADFVRLATSDEVLEVRAETVEAAIAQLPESIRERMLAFTERPIVILRTPRQVMEDLRGHGWHSGNWRDIHGRDRGLNEILDYPEDEWPERLKPWIDCLQGEADLMNDGKVCVWNPRATAAAFVAASSRRVIEIEAADVQEALGKFVEATSEAKP